MVEILNVLDVELRLMISIILFVLVWEKMLPLMKEVADNVSVKKGKKRLQVWVSNEDDVNKFAIISLQRFFSLIDENINEQDQRQDLTNFRKVFKWESGGSHSIQKFSLHVFDVLNGLLDYDS